MGGGCFDVRFAVNGIEYWETFKGESFHEFCHL